MLDQHQVMRHVLKKQQLAPENAGTDLLAAVEDMVGLHGTSPTTPYLSLHARMHTFMRADLDCELYERRSLIRLKVMRGTVFVLPHAIAPVAYAATQAMVVKRDRRHLGLDPAVYETLAPAVLQALVGRSLTLAELRVAVGSDRDLAAVVTLLCDEGRLVRDRPTGSWRSATFSYRLWQEVLPEVDLAAYEKEEAIRALVRRYLAAYGPATLSDAAWWTGLGVSPVRRAAQQLGDEVVEVTVNGLPDRLLMMRDDLAALQTTPPMEGPCVAVLPELDPLIMGYKERDRYLQPRNRGLVFDRGGNATSTILVDGLIVGVWDVADRPEPSVRVLLFDPAQRERDTIVERAGAAGAFWFGGFVPVIEYAEMVPLTKRSGWVRKPLDDARRVRLLLKQ